MKSIHVNTQTKFLTDKELIINWEFLWKNKKKIFSKVIEIEEKIIELDIIEGKIKKNLQKILRITLPHRTLHQKHHQII